MVRRIADIKKTKRNRKTNDNTENNLKKTIAETTGVPTLYVFLSVVARVN